MEEEELTMTCRLPYPLPYILILLFSVLSFIVNILYDGLNQGYWYPPAFSYDFEYFRQRPYEVLVYVIGILAAIVIVVYMVMPQSKRNNQTQTQMVLRWFAHLISFTFLLMIWILEASQLWIYQICLYSSDQGARYAENNRWNDPLYSIIYSITIVYGFFVVFPCIAYLIRYYFIKAQQNYKANPQTVYIHPIYNKVCYFATYISVITIMALNLKYLDDYQNYFIYTLYPTYEYAFLEVQMSLPITYLEYVFSGLALLFSAFLFVKQIFDTMKSKKKHIRRQLLVLTSAMFCIGVLTINKILEVTRLNEVIKADGIPNISQPFYQLYDHTRTIMWCYIFLLLPLTIYSTRNYWRQWKNQFASGQHTETEASSHHIMADDIEVVEEGRRERKAEGTVRRKKKGEREEAEVGQPKQQLESVLIDQSEKQ